MTSPPRPTLASSLPLHRWLAQDPQWQSKGIGWRAARHWQSLWGSVNHGLSRAIASQETALKLQDPILIVGPWRSGTTVMHELLTAASGCATPLTWQCMNACAFQLGGQSGKRVSVARPMDGLEISGDSPQEDEFALLTLGVPSAYRAFLMPHRINELLPTLDQAFWLDSPSWLETWEGFLRGVLRTSGAAHQPLILKSPNHTFRLKSILQRFPRAKLIWMARDPVDVFQSNRKMWRAMFAAHGITTADPSALDDFLTHAIQACAETLVWCDDNLPPDQFMVCPQRQLLKNPTSTLQTLFSRLDGFETVDAEALGLAVARTSSGRVETYIGNPPVESSVALQRLAHAQQTAASRRWS